MKLRRLIFVFILLCLINPFLYAQEDEQEADQQINEFSLAGYGEKGEKTWELSAKTADIFGDLIKLKQVIGNLYREKEDIKLTADRGQFHKTKGLIQLEQNVVITTATGARLTTDTLDWDRKNKIVNTEDRVSIEKENMLTIAKGARAEPDLNKILLKEDVQVTINPVQDKVDSEAIEKERTVITCDGPLQIDYAKNIATFNNNVKVDRQNLKIYSDVMDVYFTPEGKESAAAKEAPSLMGTKIRKVVARQNVKIVRGENISYSDEAVYVAKDEKIILSGRAKLIIYSKEDLSALVGD